MENKPASLLAVPLGKALSGISPSWCGRQNGRPLLSELDTALRSLSRDRRINIRVFHFFTIFEIKNARGAIGWGLGKKFESQHFFRL